MTGNENGNRRRQTISGMLGDRVGTSPMPLPGDRAPEPAPQPSVIIDQQQANFPATEPVPEGGRAWNDR